MAACSLALVAKVGGVTPWLWRGSFLLQCLLSLWNTSCRCPRASVVVAQGLRCYPGCGIFLDQGLNLCPLQAGRWILNCWTTRAALKKVLDTSSHPKSFGVGHTCLWTFSIGLNFKNFLVWTRSLLDQMSDASFRQDQVSCGEYCFFNALQTLSLLKYLQKYVPCLCERVQWMSYF